MSMQLSGGKIAVKQISTIFFAKRSETICSTVGASHFLSLIQYT